jgi:hypothetical protein
LPNYDHTQHIIFPTPNPYTADHLVVVPSENSQIQGFVASRRLAPPTRNPSPSYSRAARRDKKAVSRNEQDASDTNAPSLGTTTWVTKQSDIKNYMTPTKQLAKQPAEVIEINTNNSASVTQQQQTEGSIQATTVISPTHLPEMEGESSVEGKEEPSTTTKEVRVDDTEIPTETTTTIVHTTEAVEVATTTNIEPNATNDRIEQVIDRTGPEIAEAPAVDQPQALTPQKTIDQILADTPAPTEQEAAEALGELALTAVEQPISEEEPKKRKKTTTTPSPATTVMKRRKFTRNRYY